MSSNSYKRLLDYIENRMQMQHIYQPVMLDALLSNDGECPVSEIARALEKVNSIPSTIEGTGKSVPLVNNLNGIRWSRTLYRRNR